MAGQSVTTCIKVVHIFLLITMLQAHLGLCSYHESLTGNLNLHSKNVLGPASKTWHYPLASHSLNKVTALSQRQINLHKKHNQEQELCAGTSSSLCFLPHRRGVQCSPTRKPRGTAQCWGWTSQQRCCLLAPGLICIRYSPSSVKKEDKVNLHLAINIRKSTAD